MVFGFSIPRSRMKGLAGSSFCCFRFRTQQLVGISLARYGPALITCFEIENNLGTIQANHPECQNFATGNNWQWTYWASWCPRSWISRSASLSLVTSCLIATFNYLTDSNLLSAWEEIESLLMNERSLSSSGHYPGRREFDHVWDPYQLGAKIDRQIINLR